MNGGTINIFFVLPSAADRDYKVGEFSDALADYIGDVPTISIFTTIVAFIPYFYFYGMLGNMFGR